MDSSAVRVQDSIDLEMFVVSIPRLAHWAGSARGSLASKRHGNEKSILIVMIESRTRDRRSGMVFAGGHAFSKMWLRYRSPWPLQASDNWSDAMNQPNAVLMNRSL